MQVQEALELPHTVLPAMIVAVHSHVVLSHSAVPTSPVVVRSCDEWLWPTVQGGWQLPPSLEALASATLPNPPVSLKPTTAVT